MAVAPVNDAVYRFHFENRRIHEGPPPSNGRVLYQLGGSRLGHHEAMINGLRWPRLRLHGDNQLSRRQGRVVDLLAAGIIWCPALKKAQ